MMWPHFDPWLAGATAADVWLAGHSGPGAIDVRRQRRLTMLLSDAARHSRLYREILKGKEPCEVPLDSLPVVSKHELMQRFDDWVCDPALSLEELREHTGSRQNIGAPFQGRYIVWESSGSSGVPGIFVQDAGAMAVYDALEVLRRPAPAAAASSWLASWLEHKRLVFVGATDGHFASIVSIQRLRALNPAFARQASCVSFLQPIDSLVRELNDARPNVLATYPSAAVLLAQEQRAGNLRMSLSEVWTGGETLTRSMRGEIESAFACRVHNSYGASEAFALASECAFQRLHLNADWFILESVDERGKPVPAGVAGATTWLTNLANRVQPIIRYDLGDSVVLGPTALCDCGSCLPVIEVQGRRDDTLLLRGARRNRVPVLPLAVTTVLEDEAGLFDFQVRQLGPSKLALSTGLHGTAGRRQLRSAATVLQQFLIDQGVAPVDLELHTGKVLTAGLSGKRARVVRAQ